MKRQLLMKKRRQRSRETMKQRPVRKKRSRTVRTAISKPKKSTSGSEENTQKEQDGETERPPTQNPQENGNDKEPKQSITIITGIMIAMNIGNPIGIMKIRQTEGIRTATGTERRMPINIKIRREVPANKPHY